MFLYSVILSRTFDVIMKDMGSLHTSLLTDNSRTTQVSVRHLKNFCLWVDSDFINLLPVRFHQAEILIVGHNNEAWMGVELLTFGS